MLKNYQKRSDRRRAQIKTCCCILCRDYTEHRRNGRKPYVDDMVQQLEEYYLDKEEEVRDK